MKAIAIIGANYGDEGKGLMTDFLCARYGAELVVRFNGGAQAGHTVVTPEGQRHVFHHFGSGSFLGVPTFLNKHFIVNPILYAQERAALVSMGVVPEVYVHPECRVTIPADMLLNQYHERSRRGDGGMHGSCGIGIHETVKRHAAGATFTVKDVVGGNVNKYVQVMLNYALPLMDELAAALADATEELLFSSIKTFQDTVTPTDGNAFVNNTVVFEGAQGLMLDELHPDFPHVTHSRTGMHNVREQCAEWGLEARDVTTVYVTRSYLTRHGAGPLPGETPMPDFVKDTTNIPNVFQGELRYAPLDVDALCARAYADAMGINWGLAVTHIDESRGAFGEILKRAPVSYFSKGPTRYDVT